MTFGAHHYVPVLKVKRGEKAALTEIARPLRQRITPLLEIVTRTGEKTIEGHLDTAFKGLADSTRPYGRCFLDAHELGGDGPDAAEKVFRRASSEGIVFTPVTGISRTADVEAVLQHSAEGIALRLTRQEFQDGRLASGIQGFITTHDLSPGSVDLIIDLGPVDDMVKAGVIALAAAFMAAVPDHVQWRTFTVSACAFPKGMAGVERWSHDGVERVDWVAWRDGLQARRHKLARLPAFSDGAIQHPSGVEGFEFGKYQVSASIRYALSDAWLRIKGESTKSSPLTAQFPKLASALVRGQFRQEFSGPEHCTGCEAMARAADGAPRLGSLEVWRRLGTIHHVSTVMQALAALSWS